MAHSNDCPRGSGGADQGLVLVSHPWGTFKWMCREGVVHTCWASLGSQAATLGQASLGLLVAPAPGMLQLCGYFWNEVSYLLQSLHLNILHRTLFYYRRFVIATCLYSYWNVALRDEAKQRCPAQLAVLAFDRIMREAVALISSLSTGKWSNGSSYFPWTAVCVLALAPDVCTCIIHLWMEGRWGKGWCEGEEGLQSGGYICYPFTVSVKKEMSRWKINLQLVSWAKYWKQIFSLRIDLA